MSDITVLGLGLMGSALAHSLQSAGHQITVWNRSADKMSPFVSRGALGPSSIEEAVKSSPLTLVCIDSYATTEQLLGADDVLPGLKNRTVVQLGTGTPNEALGGEVWFNEHGAAYLDGAILATPLDIKGNKGDILIGGSERAWESSEPVLRCLGGNLIYTGDNIRAPSILDLAWLIQRLGQYLGLFQGVLLCEAGGVGLDLYSSILADGRMRQVLNTISENDFSDPSVTVNVYRNVLQHITDCAAEGGVEREILDNLKKLLDRAQSAGYGEEDIAALIKVSRNQKSG